MEVIVAIIHGIEKYPQCTDVILIADNKSKVRDIELYDKVTKPVKVVLCGAEIGANVQYLNLARTTGGSVHTIEEDIENLIELNEGEEFSVGNSLFKIVDGKIVLIYERGSDDDF